jgi:hypothetical protein
MAPELDRQTQRENPYQAADAKNSERAKCKESRGEREHVRKIMLKEKTCNLIFIFFFISSSIFFSLKAKVMNINAPSMWKKGVQMTLVSSSVVESYVHAQSFPLDESFLRPETMCHGLGLYCPPMAHVLEVGRWWGLVGDFRSLGVCHQMGLWDPPLPLSIFVFSPPEGNQLALRCTPDMKRCLNTGPDITRSLDRGLKPPSL